MFQTRFLAFSLLALTATSQHLNASAPIMLLPEDVARQAFIEKRREALEMFIAGGGSPDAFLSPDKLPGVRLLHAAAQATKNLVEFLCQAGATINMQEDDDGKTPLMEAILCDKDRIASYLITQHVLRRITLENRAKNGCTAFLLAAKKNNTSTGNILANAGANTKAADNDADNALHLAAYCGSENFVEFLLDLPADKAVDIAATNAKGFNALDIATGKKHDGIVILLRNAGLTQHTEAFRIQKLSVSLTELSMLSALHAAVGAASRPADDSDADNENTNGNPQPEEAPSRREGPGDCRAQ